jgi:hypothetical protein
MIDLITHIEGINEKSRQEMAENPGTFIGLLAEDRKHWNDQGIFTTEQFEFQMEYYSLYDYIGCVTSKSYARYLLQDCKTMDDLNMVYIEFAQPSEVETCTNGAIDEVA